MKKSLLIPLVGLAALAGACHHGDKESAPELLSNVNTKIGSGGHGHVFVGASVPYGMVQAGPTSLPQTWDWTSGYHDSDSTVIGFSQTHLSGTGIGDLFDVTLMPVIGEVNYSRGIPEDETSGLWSYADRSQEVTQPGYYSVPLTRYGILAEIAATNRVGLHRYTFPATDSAAIVIDLKNGGCWDRTVDGTEMVQLNENTITGRRHSRGWANDQNVYFVAEFSEPIANFTLNGENDLYGRVDFAPADSARTIMVKVGISPTSVDAAMSNLMAEAADITFEEAVELANNAWENELARIVIDTDDPEELQKFYTAMYHLTVHPSTFNDYGTDPEYTVLSLWDTYRAQMPLLTILDPEKAGEITNSMLNIHDNQGRLPVWHLWGNETDCMVGNPGIIVVADAVTKQLPGVDIQRALKAMIETSNDTARGGKYRQEYGFIPVDKMQEAIAWDMEYAIADAAIANAAASIGEQEIADTYTQRSKSYRNYMDPETHFARGKYSNGEWRTPFNPSFSSRGNDYCEGNAWQYTWLVPQDVEGLQEFFGGKEAMLSRLDSLFTASPEMVGDDVTPDISGMIGQYVQGNEPSHHIAYIYSMVGEREKTAQLVEQILDEQYAAAPDGLSGNEDCGQMSAWYIFSSLGFYPVEPAAGRYWLGTPRYNSATINLPQGKKFTVKKSTAKDGKIMLNGNALDRNYITHDEIMQGGELVF